MALTNVGFGHRTGRFIRVEGDSEDPGRDPDAVPITDGTVTFIPSATKLLAIDAQDDGVPAPATFVPQVVTCTTDDDGYLIDAQGERGVFLLANDEGVNPTDWTYRVEFGGGLSVLPAFSIEVLADSDEDLAVESPVPSSNGTAIVRGPAGDPGDPEQIEQAVIDYLTENPPAGVTWESLDGKPAAFPPEDHSHSLDDVTGLDDALDGKADIGHGHVIADVEGLQAALDDAAGSGGGNGGPVSWNDIEGKPSMFPPSEHGGHTIAQVNGLQGALDSKAADDDPRLSDERDPNPHTHGVGDLDATGTPSDSTFLRGDGSWAQPPAGGGGGVTDHGDLTGLDADGHPQYALADGSRGDFAATGHDHDADYAAIDHSHSEYADAMHSHEQSDVDGLGAALAGKADDADVSALDGRVETLENAPDPVTSYDQLTDVPGEFTPAPHTHSIDDVNGLTDELAALNARARVWVLSEMDPVPAEAVEGDLIVRMES